MFKRIFKRKASVTTDLLQVPAEYDGCVLIRNGPPREAGNLGLTVIDVEVDNGQVTITPALGNPLPLCWGWSAEGSLVIADSAPQVLEEIAGRKTPSLDDLDAVGVVESIIFDGPLVDRTLFKGVKKTQIGERIAFDLNSRSHTKQWVWLPHLQRMESGNPLEIAARAEALIRGLADNLPPSGEGVVLPISGGLDSRLLASLSVGRVGDIFSYTFQKGWSYESYCGRRVARSIGAKHKTFELGARCYRQVARVVIANTGGLVTGMHSHGIYCCEELLDEPLRGRPRIFGYFGDPVCGAMAQLAGGDIVGANPDSLLKSYQWTAFPELLVRFRNEILGDLTQTWDAFIRSGSPSHCFLEFWKIQQRQNNLINQLFHYHRAHHGVQVWMPFIDREFADYFISLPEGLRENRNLFKTLVRKIYPEVFKLPSNHFHKNSFMGHVENVFERLESLANVISPKQTVVLSPFKYEHHDKNIVNYLLGDVARGMSVMSEFFDVKPFEPVMPLWKQAPEKDFYRIAALGALVDTSAT